MQNVGPDESQAGRKNSRRNTNNLRYADDTILTVESEEELKERASWWRWKRKVKKGLAWNFAFKHKIMASSPITSWQIEDKK